MLFERSKILVRYSKAKLSEHIGNLVLKQFSTVFVILERYERGKSKLEELSTSNETV
jgi:hypothetical protein